MASTDMSKHTGAKKAPPKKAPAKRAEGDDAPDAITLLKADHRQVEDWFEQFENARSDAKKAELAQSICAALKTHTEIEEEIFYPAFLEATGDQDMNDEAIVEHDGAKKLIAEIEAGQPGDDLWEAKVKVLSEMIKHHVKEEEQPGGMFAKAKKSDMDLEELGAALAARKEALMEAQA
ncbi:MAG: hemerythrin domain-containing protein [Hyphomonadaceae bacterium]